MPHGASSGFRKLTIWLLLTVPVVIGLLTGAYYTVALSACASCHDDAVFMDATRASAHATVDCAACHMPAGRTGRLAFGVRHLLNIAAPSVENVRDVSAISNARCLACHDAILSEVVETNGLRVDHALCAADRSCTDCHSTTAHGDQVSWQRVYDMATCLRCHVSEASAECDVCHEGRPPADRVTSGVFAVTHGPQWEQTHGMGDSATCTACHTAASCATCHGPGLPHDADFLGVHADTAERDDAQCADCHDTSFCDSCHGLPMPHTAQFTRGHAEAARNDEALCQRCHAGSDCVTCHETHVHPGGAIDTLSGGTGAR